MEKSKVTSLDTGKAVDRFNREGMPPKQEPVAPPKKEMSPELKEYITDTCKTIIFDSLPKEALEDYLYNVTVNTNEQTGDFEVAILNIFPIPKNMTDFVCVNAVVLDLIEKKVSAPPIMFCPIIIRKDRNGIDRDAVMLGRYGDISIVNSTPTNTIAPQYEIDAYYRHQAQDAERVEDAEVVEGSVFKTAEEVAAELNSDSVEE